MIFATSSDTRTDLPIRARFVGHHLIHEGDQIDVGLACRRAVPPRGRPNTRPDRRAGVLNVLIASIEPFPPGRHARDRRISRPTSAAAQRVEGARDGMIGVRFIITYRSGAMERPRGQRPSERY